MSEDKKLPEYLAQTDDGDMDITLRRAIKIDGASVKVLRMREPTVTDQLVMEATKGDDRAKEITMFANLCSLTPGDIKLLTLHDYQRVGEGFSTFLH